MRYFSTFWSDAYGPPKPGIFLFPFNWKNYFPWLLGMQFPTSKECFAILDLHGSWAYCSNTLKYNFESFTDYVSDLERQMLKAALASSTLFSSAIRSDLVNILSRFGCRQIPTHLNLLTAQAAQCEFCAKPAASLALIHYGIPNNHKAFWENTSASDVHALYYGQSVNPSKVLPMLEGNLLSSTCDKLMIGNMQVSELSLFLRFVTGASVCTVPIIRVEFNISNGLGHRPIAHTCDSLLSYPLLIMIMKTSTENSKTYLT